MATGFGRRTFLALLGSAAVNPLLGARMASAQQSMPVIGFLNASNPEAYVNRLRGFHLGLKDAGFAEGENVAIIYRWAENRVERLPALAADLVQRKVSAIVTGTGNLPAIAVNTATTSVPAVFVVSEDPVKSRFVESIARPGGHMTGINFFNAEVNAKRLEILRQLIPQAKRVAVLVNQTNVPNTESLLQEIGSAGDAIGLQLEILNASTIEEIDAVFEPFAKTAPDAVYVGGDSLFNSRRQQLALLCARYRIPAVYASRDYPESGGLMSYGTNVTDAFRQAGRYAGRILRGTKPAELPVVQASKFELVINAQAARIVELPIPPSLLSIADEVIE
jgi:putative ABC transport system substrate-binding protein